MNTLRRADQIAGTILLLLSLVVLWGTYQIPNQGMEGIHPRTFPALIGFTLLACAIALLLTACRSPGDQAVAWPGAPALRRMGVVLGSLVACLLLLERLGFPLTVLLLMPFLVRYLGRGGLLSPILTGAITAAVIYFGFMEFLGLALPAGPLN